MNASPEIRPLSTKGALPFEQKCEYAAGLRLEALVKNASQKLK
jgi:hypothetical protein